jgi:2-oxoglutarate dehydrogenase complex dehydrogenase (E1) component-like enzyme
MLFRHLSAQSPLPLLDIAFVRLEQLVPFPFADVARHILHYPNAEIVWCQVSTLTSTQRERGRD